MGIGAYEIPGLRFSLPAGADVNRFRFVAINSNGEGEQATASDVIIGASMNQAADGEVLEVADGIVIIEASAAIAAGAMVVSDANGKAATAGEGGSSAIIALTAASAAGEFISVKI